MMANKKYVFWLIILGAIAAFGLVMLTGRNGNPTRLATVPLGAEITGLYVYDGDLFMNVMHPNADLISEYAKATVGVFANANFKADAQPVPKGLARETINSTLGEYQVLFQEGEFGILGAIPAADGTPMFVSRNPDFNGYVPIDENSGYLFTGWENRPGGISRVKLSRNSDGVWTANPDTAEMLDFRSVGGTWGNCFGTVSPWQTPLSSEELFFDNTDDWNNPLGQDFEARERLAAQLGHFPNPYRLGYIIEITKPKGASIPKKRYAMGRFSHENAVVMPDDRTVYLSDDGTNTALFKFVSDTPGNLSSGVLYAAKMMQDIPGSEADPASTGFSISWIKLAHGNETDIQSWIREYDGITPDMYSSSKTSYISNEEVLLWADGKAADDRVAFLESRKAAAALGATTELRKMEGVNVNYSGMKAGTAPFMYLAVSEISQGMTDGLGDIRLAKNLCGVVYQLTLDSKFNATRMNPVVSGKDRGINSGSNRCDAERISNPDNLIVLQDGTVVIGEDTSKHDNNALWAWRPE